MIAPNLDLFLWRPVVADPPIYTQRDLYEKANEESTK
jgi:hypothetical protein